MIGRAPSTVALSRAIRAHVDAGEVAGAVACVVDGERVLQAVTAGLADREAARPMRTDTLFWIASMTKPVTACAVMMLLDEGKLELDAPVSAYLPEFSGLKTADGRPAVPTLRQMLTHTSGMAEPTQAEQLAARTLSDLMPHIADKPALFTPGARWQYSQSGMNALGRVVEVRSGMPFDRFLAERLFKPLDMRDTTFYPDAERLARLAVSYRRTGDRLERAALPPVYDCARGDARFPAPNGGLYSTAPDYARFCQMLINRGSLRGRRILSAASVAAMSTVQSGELKTGFTPGCAWGLGCCMVREPQGVTAMLAPGSFGHGGAYGTQAWIDPVKGVAYVLMVQRANFPNADNSDLRGDFQRAAY
jgi:CubicO group peptidase (beta-lactamase class C family)